MDWDDLRFFLMVARTGNLLESARQLRASPSTVSRRLGQLEAALGVTLFARHPSGHRLTDEGRALLARAEPVADALNLLEAEVAGRTRAEVGEVRLATAEIFATHLLIPHLPDFRVRQPGIRLQLVTSAHTVNLTRREADIALRLSRPDQGSLILRKAGVLAYGLYAAPGYGGNAVIGWDETMAHLPLPRWIAENLKEREPSLFVTSLGQAVVAARAGLGVALLPCLVGDGEPGLVRVAGPEGLLAMDIWLVTHGDLAGSARMRAVSDFLVETVARERPRLLGLYPTSG